MNIYNRIKAGPIQKRNATVDRLANWILAQNSVNLDMYSTYKSGCAQERVPADEKWAYKRAAAMLIAGIHNPRSVKFYRKHFASLKNRGVKKDRLTYASGYIIRHMLQALEKVGYMVQYEKKGRYTDSKVVALIVTLYGDK